MNAVYLPYENFERRNSFFYNYHTATHEYEYYNRLETHDFYEIQLYQNSAHDSSELLGHVTIGSQEYPVFHNDLILVDIFKPHKTEIESEHYSRYCVHIAPSFLNSINLPETDLFAFFDASRNPPVPLNISKRQSEQTVQLFRLLDVQRSPHGDDLYKQGILCLLLADMFNLYHDRLSANPPEKKTALLPQIVQYIDMHLDSPLLLEELSANLHFSVSYLCHYFKNCTDTTLKRYMMDKKLELSKQLLAVYPVTEVAEKVGFNSYNSFYRFFKNNSGVSPNDYKNSLIMPHGRPSSSVE